MSAFTDDFTQLGVDSMRVTESTLPFDDNFFASEPQQLDSGLLGADSDSVKHSPAREDFVTPIMAEESPAVGEWRRQNAAEIAQKEKREKELLNQIIIEADEYKVRFYEKLVNSRENRKATNRAKEKVFIASRENFYAEADKNYWKAIIELIPNEVATVEKKRAKKDEGNKPSIAVIQGPKPGKRTDLSRMRQILLKLKHDSPPHLRPSPPTGHNSPTSTDAATEAVLVA